MNFKTMNTPDDVRFIINKLQENNYKAYMVGGCVRDSILGETPKDYDITTNCKPEIIVSIFKMECFNVIETGLKHGTVTVMINDIGYEITTFRIDGEYSDHRHSDEVVFIDDIIQDLARRDFTINAMAYNEFEGLIDPFNGIEDLKNNIIKCVGNPMERFDEDALRMIRAIRFSCRFGFKIEPETLKAIIEHSSTVEYVSKERIKDELCKILLSDRPAQGIKSLQESGLLEFIIPDLIPCVGFDQHNKHHDKNVFEHILAVLTNSPKRLNVRLAALLHDIGKPNSYTIGDDGQGHFYSHHMVSADITFDVLNNLKFDNNTISKVHILVREHMSRYDKLRVASTKRFINRVGIDNLEDLFDLQIADIKGSAPEYQDFSSVEILKDECTRIINEKQPLGLKDININGDDLIKLGYKPGKEMGLILKEILDLVLEEKIINEKEILVKHVLERIS